MFNAKGGLVNAHTLAEIGEYGRREAVLPLENRRTMNMIAESIMQNYNSSFGEAGSAGIRDAITQPQCKNLK